MRASPEWAIHMTPNRFVYQVYSYYIFIPYFSVISWWLVTI
jgi:hypothetical protein